MLAGISLVAALFALLLSAARLVEAGYAARKVPSLAAEKVTWTSPVYCGSPSWCRPETRRIAWSVDELPEGWPGKNHAVYAGAELANGEWLLFTAADIRFRRDVMQRAVAYAERQDLDHLLLVPELDLKGTGYAALLPSSTWLSCSTGATTGPMSRRQRPGSASGLST